PAPTLIEPNEDAITGKVKPVITGLTVNNTFVHVFVDGKHNGKTEILKHSSGTANFSYKPFLNLTTGWHTVWARTEDASGRVSQTSKFLRFYIENPMPAPIVIKVDPRAKYNQPLITGLSKNSAKIRIFINHKLNGEFLVANHESGTANFSYLPFLELKPGSHIIYATAVDTRGKESIWSNIVYYNAGARLAVDSEARKEDNETNIIDLEEKIKDIEKIDEINLDKDIEDKKREAKQIIDEGIDSESAAAGSDLADILSSVQSDSEEESGLVDESHEVQSKLKLNLVIFIVFLFAVIGWVFWVNRELIKEKREQNKQDKEE
ncbi:MAG: Ig-like domain-containing protein, partial [Patescibacteria group bacterium]|nr:Ig-like domain-containing protein [Patescibacteria group bacterium]